MLKVRVFGRFEVEKDGRPIPPAAWRRRRPADLLKLLASRAGRPLSREEVIDRLWPDKARGDGANNLHRALYDLRQMIGERDVAADKGRIRFSDDVWCDVSAFESALSNGNLDTALELYRGDLCADDSDSEWLLERRAELHQRFVEAGLQHARQAIADGRDVLAIDLLRRLLAIEPAEEDAHRLLMRALVATGGRHEAMRQYEALRKSLADRLDQEPSAETHALYERIARGEMETRPGGGLVGWKRLSRRLLGTANPPPIRGQDALLLALPRPPKSSGVFLLMGEAGSGKTRLAIDVARRLGDEGAVMLAGAASELGSSAPFGPFQEAFVDHLRETGRSLAENPLSAFQPTPGGAMEKDRLRLFQSIERALEDFASGRTMLVIVDDLQWADESSLHLFHHLARKTRTVELLLLGTLREEEVIAGTPLHALLIGLQRERLVTRLRVERLGRSGTLEQVADILGREPDAETASAVYRLSGGNPFFTEEVTRGIEESGTALSEDLLENVRTRLDLLGSDAGRLLRAAAVIGLEFPFRWAQRASGLEEPTALGSLEAALRANQIEESETGYRFRHALVREALYGSLAKARRVQLHRAAADALEAEPEVVRSGLMGQIAQHHLAGEQPERAIPCLIAAGRSAASRAGVREAVSLFERALELMDQLAHPPSPERFGLLLASGQMLFALADLEAATARLDSAARLFRAEDGWRPPPGERAKALRIGSLAAITAGDLDGAERRLDEARSITPEGDLELPQVLYNLAQVRWHQERHKEAYSLAEQCLREAEKHGDAVTIGKGYEMLALACHSLGEWKDGLEYVEKRKQAVGQTLDVAQIFDVHL